MTPEDPDPFNDDIIWEDDDEVIEAVCDIENPDVCESCQ